MLFPLRVQHTVCSSYAVSSEVLHSRYYLILEINICRHMIIEIFLELMIWYLITFLVFTIILSILLHSIVSEMSKQIFCILVTVLAWCSSNISLTVPIAFHFSIMASDHHIVPYVEFTFLIEQRFLYVFLNNKCAVCAICIMFFWFQPIFYLVESWADSYSSPAVCKLSWLYYPNVPELFIRFPFLVLLLEFV